MSSLRKRIGWRAGLSAAALAAIVAGGAPAYPLTGGDAVTDTSHAFVVKLQIGEVRSCTGVLVTRRWVLTSASCFATDGQPAAAGVPVLPTLATIGSSDLSQPGGHVLPVVKLVPREDRDVVLAELAAPVLGTAPIAVSGSAPATGETLRTDGYGRTATDWAPNQPHTALFQVAASDATTLSLTGTTPEAGLCKGDAGGPLFREGGAAPALVGIDTAAWQHGCLDSTETRQGATGTRVDDLGSWITSTSFTPASYDFDGDNKADLIARDSDGKLYLYPGTGIPGPTTTFSDRFQIGIQWQNMTAIRAGELTGDGRLDILAVDATGAMWLYPNTSTPGAPSLGQQIQIGSGFHAYDAVNVADVDGDSRADVIARNAAGDLMLFSNTGGTGLNTFAQPVKVGNGWSGFTFLTMTDMNADDRPDIVARDSSGNLLLYANLGEGGVHTFTPTGTRIGTAWSPFTFITCADLNDDGLPDLLGRNGAGLLQFYANTGTPDAPAFPSNVQVGNGWSNYTIV